MRRFLSRLRLRRGDRDDAGRGPRRAPSGNAADPPPGTRPDGPGARTLDAVERDAFEALREGLSALGSFLPAPDEDLRGPVERPHDVPPADFLALRDAKAFRLTPSLRFLAWCVVESAIAGEGSELRGQLEPAARKVRAQAERLPPPEKGRPVRRKDLERCAARDLRSLLREIAAEHGRTVLEVSDAGGRSRGEVALAWAPGEAEAIDRALLERLFERFEAAVMGDDLLILQRRISRWWFHRFSPKGRNGPERFGRRIREVEWAFVDRPIPGIDCTVLDVLLRDPVAADLPRRQASLALRLDDSVTSGFEVVARKGDLSVFQDLAGGARYDVWEHDPHLGYHAGDVALGRVIPGEGARWLRSPGTAFLGSGSDGLASLVERSLDASDREGIPRSLVVEGTLLALITDETPPRKVRPALTRRLAKDLAFRTIDLLEEAGLARPVEGEERAEAMAAARTRRRGSGELRAMSLMLDEVTADWLAALDDQRRGRV